MFRRVLIKGIADASDELWGNFQNMPERLYGAARMFSSKKEFQMIQDREAATILYQAMIRASDGIGEALVLVWDKLSADERKVAKSAVDSIITEISARGNFPLERTHPNLMPKGETPDL